MITQQDNSNELILSSRGGTKWVLDTKSRDVAGSGKSGFTIVQLEGRDAKSVFFLEAGTNTKYVFCVFSQFAIVQLVAWERTVF